MTNPEPSTSALEKLDKLLEHRSRLGACVLLSGPDRMSFSSLRQALKETDGNMGAQLRKLEDAGYIKVSKKFENRRPVSWYSLTKKGEKALRTHLDALQILIQSARV